jgi:hypothetical protein
VYRSPAGDPITFQRYLSGSDFAKFEVVSRHCPNARWLSASDDPELGQTMAAAIQPKSAKFRMVASASAGSAGFLCGNRQGYASAVTIVMRQGRQEAWFIPSLGVFLSADPLRSMETRYVMEHMLGTMKVDPTWQKALDDRIIAKTGSIISSQNAQFAAQQASARNASSTLSRMNHPNEGVRTRSGSSSPASISRDSERMCDAIGRCQSVVSDGRPMYMDHSGRVAPGPAGGGPPDNSGVWAQIYHQ